MGKQVIPDGVYTVMGPGGQLTAAGGRIMMLQPGDGPPELQRWQVAFDKGSYTLRNAAIPVFVGTDGNPAQPAPVLPGSGRPFPWTLVDGGDGNPTTFRVASAAAEDQLQLAPSPFRMWPPQVGLLPVPPEFGYEWAFTPAR